MLMALIEMVLVVFPFPSSTVASPSHRPQTPSLGEGRATTTTTTMIYRPHPLHRPALHLSSVTPSHFSLLTSSPSFTLLLSCSPFLCFLCSLSRSPCCSLSLSTPPEPDHHLSLLLCSGSHRARACSHPHHLPWSLLHQCSATRV